VTHSTHVKKNEFTNTQHTFYHAPELTAVMNTSMHTKPATEGNFQAGFTIYDKIFGHTTKFLPCNTSIFSSYNIFQL